MGVWRRSAACLRETGAGTIGPSSSPTDRDRGPAMSEPHTSAPSSHGVSVVGLDEATSTLSVDGRSIPLTPTQFSIVAYLVRRPARWVRAGEIIEHVLHTNHEPDTAVIRVHVYAIRRRLGDAARYLEGDRHYWRGYRWVTSQRSAAVGRRSSSPLAHRPRRRVRH